MKSDRQLLKTKTYFTFLNKLYSYWSINSISWLIAIATILIGAKAAKADTYTVDNTNDSGAGSLREAVRQAEANAGPDTIVIDSRLAGQTITLTSKDNNIQRLSGKDCSGVSRYTPYGALQITESLTIDGSKAPDIRINGNWNGNDKSTQGNRTFYVPSPNNRPVGSSTSAIILNLNDITLENGNAGPLVGGGAFNDPCSNGGNIYFDSPGGELNLTRVNIKNGHANDGGGLNVERGDLNIFNSTLSENKTRDDGGAIDFSGGDTAILVNSTLANNQAGFGANSSTNRGGAIRLDGTLNMTYVTAAYNTASGEGGFIENRGTLNVRNSLLVDNDSDISGGDNKHCRNTQGTINNLGNNWESVNNSGDAPTCTGFNKDTEANIQLSPNLADNGGLTQTLSLNMSSSINGAINPATNDDCPEGVGRTDQRYFFRAVGSAGCEPGAYELQDAPDSAPTIDLDGADATAAGNDFATNYFLGEDPVKVTSTDTTATDDTQDTVISDPNAQPIKQASIEIDPTNVQAGDLLTINGALPRGIALNTIDSTDTKIVLNGRAFWSEYEQALELIEFSTTSTDKSDRTINFQVTDTTDIASNVAISTISIQERDYGDAPSIFDDTPASHILTPNLYLGSVAPDSETAPQNTPDADGDDNTISPNVDDEDGISNFPSLTSSNDSYSITSLLNNNSGSPANVYAWIDFDRDGEFDQDERATVVNGSISLNGNGKVPTGSSGTVTLNWNNLGGTGADITSGDSYLRVRLTSDEIDQTVETTERDDASVDIATDGEVEDYPIAIATSVDTVSGTVYEDFGASGDNNNTLDSGEGTIGNVTVNLFEDNNNDNQPDGAAVQTVETDESTGTYQFTNVAVGRYLIQVDTRDTDIPGTYAIGTPNPIQINVSNTDITDRDFGFNTVTKTCPPGSFLPEQTFLDFQNPAAEPGTTDDDYSVGAIYRFSNVAADIDALVEIKSLNNATLTEIDINSFGVPSAFQPEIRANSTNPGEYSVDFDIDFVQSGTNTPVVLRKVLATGVDIDGDSTRIREASELGGNQFTTYAIDNNSRLTATELSSDRVRFESTTTFNLANITVNSLNQGSAYYDQNTQSIKYRAGLIIDSGTATNVTNERLTSLLFDCVSYNLAVTNNPGLLLVKRITAINPGQNEVRFNSFVDDPNTQNDNAQNWPDNDNVYLPGRIDVANVEPEDEVEYTIYFLSYGGKAAENVKICDVIPDNMSFVANSYAGDSGIAFLNSSASGATAANLSNVADIDEGTFYAPGTAPPTVGNSAANLCQKVNSAGNIVSVGAAENINGAIVVEIDSLPEATAPGTPVNSYGFIRFRAKVQ